MEQKPTKMWAYFLLSLHPLAAGLHPQPTGDSLLATVDGTTGSWELDVTVGVKTTSQSPLEKADPESWKGRGPAEGQRRGKGMGNEGWTAGPVSPGSPSIFATVPLSLGRPEVSAPCNQRLPGQRAARGLWNKVGLFSGALRDAELGVSRRCRRKAGGGWGLPVSCVSIYRAPDLALGLTPQSRLSAHLTSLCLLPLSCPVTRGNSMVGKVEPSPCHVLCSWGTDSLLTENARLANLALKVDSAVGAWGWEPDGLDLKPGSALTCVWPWASHLTSPPSVFPPGDGHNSRSHHRVAEGLLCAKPLPCHFQKRSSCN